MCTGLAFLVFSYVNPIPPLDGLVPNYRKLDQWKEQKHARVHLEAQRIFEQQLQQEENLTKLIPAHHPNSHAYMAGGSTDQLGEFSPTNTSSTSFSSIGMGASIGGVGTLAGMSPPSSPSLRSFKYPLPPFQIQQQQQQQRLDQEIQLPHHRIQRSSMGPEQESQESCNTSDSVNGCSMDRVAIRGKEPSLPQPRQPLQLEKCPSLNNAGELGGISALSCPSKCSLSPPPTRRGSAAASEPGSPLRYLLVDDSLETPQSAPPGDKVEDGSLDNGILRSAPQRVGNSQPSQQQRHRRPSMLGQQQFPLRTTNKPTPPHDPFRRTLPSKSTTNTAPPSNTVSGARTDVKAGQLDSIHPLKLYEGPAIRSINTAMAPAPGKEGVPPLSVPGHTLSPIEGMSGHHGIVGGIPGSVVPCHHSLKGSCTPNPIQHDLQNRPQHHLQQSLPMDSDAASENVSQPQPPLSPSTKGGANPQHSSKAQERTRHHMPDIILTLPTPAEPLSTSRRDEYFAL